MHIRQPAVAGTFYPDKPDHLQQQINSYLAAAAEQPLALDVDRIKALIVPHAGYIYSGALAARAYHLLSQRQSPIRRVILLGPAHRVALRGIALPQADAFVTPLGTVPIDQNAVRDLLQSSLVSQQPLAHAQEHSLEVQLPFLQTVLDDFTLVPLVVGQTEPDAVAALLEPFLHNHTDLIVVSSDLSHFLPYNLAQQTDTETSQLIEAKQPVLQGDQACGCYPLNGLLKLATQAQLSVKTIGQCNSGDVLGNSVVGNRDRVVGYGAYVVYR